MNNFSLMFDNFKTTLKNNSPKIKLGIGIVSGGATVFLACKSTLKVSKIIDQFNEELKNIEADETLNDSLKKQAIISLYKKTIVKLLRLYSMAIGTGVVSLVFIISAFKELDSKLNSATAATASILAAYNGLKEKFIEKYGADEFEKLLNDGYEEIVTVEEDGSTKVEKKPKKSTECVKHPFTILLEEGKSSLWPAGMTPETLISELKIINDYLISDACHRYSTGKRYKAVSAEKVADMLKYNPVSDEEAFMFSSFGKTYDPSNPHANFIEWNFDTQSYEEFLEGSGQLWITIPVDPKPRF